MGVVYEAEQVSLGRQVALKVLPQQGLAGSSDLERFRLEARAAARLQHASIVPVFGVGEQDGLHYYAMQFIAGQGLDVFFARLSAGASAEPTATLSVSSDPLSEPLSAREEAPGPGPSGRSSPTTGAMVRGHGAGAEYPAVAHDLSPEDQASNNASSLDLAGNRGEASYYRSIARMGAQVAEALACAHSQGILHRDIKPSNLLLDSQGKVWVTDFGLAKSEGSDALTHTGDLVGTLRYMAPERFDGWSSPQSDIYSLGVTLYELLTLTLLFDEPNRARLIKRVAHELPPAPRKVQRKIPRDLETIVLKAIAKEPAQRYASAGEMAEDLRRFLADTPVKARRTSEAERVWRWSRRNPALAASLVSLFLVLAFGCLGATLLWRRAERQREIAGGLRDLSETRRNEAERLRGQSEERRIAAETSAQEAQRQRVRAEANFGRARAAVDDYLNQISESQLKSVPGLQPLRRDLLRSALRFYEDFVKERGDDPTLKAGLAAAQLRLGKIQHEMGAESQAQDSLRQATELYETASRSRPDDRGIRDGLAQCYVQIGLLEMPTEQALARFERAVTLWQALRLAEPANTHYQGELANTYNLIAVVQEMRGRSAESVPAHEQAFILRRALVAAHPGDPSFQNALASSLNNLGVLLDKTSPEKHEKLAMFQRSVVHSRIACAAAPEVVRYGRFLMVSLRNVGSSETAMGHHDAALRAYLESLDVSRRLVRENPAIPSLRRELFQDYQSVGDIHREEGREAEAVRSHRQAIELLDALPKESGRDRFNIACFLALCARPAVDIGSAVSEVERAECRRNADAAMMELMQAIAAGFKSAVSFKLRDELSALRGRDDFKAIVAEIDPAGPGQSPGQAEAAAGGPNPVTTEGRRAPKLSAAGPLLSREDDEQPAALHAIGVAQAELDKLSEATTTLGQALAARRALVKGDPANARYRADVAATLVAQGRLAWKAGRLAEAVGEWREVRHLLEADIKANPNEPVLAQQLAAADIVVSQSYAEKALWAEAAEAMGMAIRHGQTDRSAAIVTTSLLAVTRDRAALLKIGPDLLEHYGKTSEPLVASGLARWCALVPGVVHDPNRLVALAQQAAVFGHTGPLWYFNLALAEYRAGRFEEAIGDAIASLESAPAAAAGPIAALNAALLAMAYHRLGQHDEASRWLDKIIPLDWRSLGRWTSSEWWDRSDFLVLKGEAIELITGKPAPDDPWLREDRARAYAQLGEKAKAEAELQAARAARSNSSDVQKGGPRR
jgi:eukaryotic-like serine/threonine-protein kinase